jgi:hypothetical protein
VVAGNPARVKRFIEARRVNMTEVKGVPFVDLVTPHAELEEGAFGVARAVCGRCIRGGPIVEEV